MLSRSPPQDYIMDNVLQSDDDEDENEPTSEEEALLMAERLNDRRVLLASFLKTAMFSVIDAKLIAPIWAMYIRVSAQVCIKCPYYYYITKIYIQCHVLVRQVNSTLHKSTL